MNSTNDEAKLNRISLLALTQFTDIFTSVPSKINAVVARLTGLWRHFAFDNPAIMHAV